MSMTNVILVLVLNEAMIQGISQNNILYYLKSITGNIQSRSHLLHRGAQ